MALIELNAEDDQALERVAPRYLKGDRMKARRVKWGIERLCVLLADTEGETEPLATDKRATT